MAILRNDTVVKSADGQHSSAIITAANIGSHSIAPNSTYYIGTSQNVFNRASGAQTLTGVSIDGNAANITAYTINQNVGTGNTPSFAGIVSSAITNYAFLQTTDTNNFWITPGNNNWGLYFETSAGGLLGGTGDSNRLGFVGAGSARFYVDLNNGNGWFGGSLTANTDSRAPIFYDSANTAYYLDPANTGTSLLVAGNVGIGATNPLTRLHVAGAIGLYQNAGSTYLYYDHSGVNTWRTGIFTDNTSTYIIGHDSGGAFATKIFAITMAGNVGIGTTSPGTKLDVVGAVTMPVIKQSTTLYAGTDITDDDSTRTVYFNIPPGGYSPVKYFKVARIKITGNYQNVSLNGYFTAVSSGVHVGSERKVEFDFIAYAATNPGAPTVTYLKRGPDTTNVLVYAVPNGGGAGTTYYDIYIKSAWYNDTNGELSIRVGYGSAVTIWQAGLDSGTSAPVDTLVNPNSNYTFDTTGNIGIGTTSPSQKLHVVGTGFASTDFRAPIFYDSDNTAYYIDAASTSNLVGLTVANTITGSVSGNAATATNVAWTGITGGARTNYLLEFQPPVSSYAGFAFKTSAAGEAGYFLVRGTSDNDVYTAEGITLVADAGWLTLAQRTTASRGVRIMTGTSSSERLKITTAGDIQFVNGNSFTYNSNVVLHAGNYGGYSAFTSSLTSTVDARAPIFYDSNDTTYYLDPANTTLSLKTRSSIVINNASAPNNLAMLNIGYSGGGETRAIDIQGGWSGGENKSITFTHASGSTNIVAQINAQHNGPGSKLRWGKLYHSGDSSAYTMELISETTTSAYLTVVGSVRAPIFYDSNDTNYYLDAAGTSRLNTTRIGNINVGSGTYLNTITPIGDTNINLSAPSGAFYFDTFPRMPGFYDSDNTAYYINPAGNSIVSSLTFDSNITIYKHNDRNLLIQGGGGTDAGLLGRGSSGQFAFQVYGSGSGSYGFLDGAWAGWDIRKVVDGDLFLNDNNTYYLNPGSTTNLNNLTVAGTMTFGTLAYTTGSRRSKNSSNVNVETVTGLVSPTGPTFLEIRGFCPTTMYRTTGDRPAPYGLGFGNGVESGGIMPIGAGDNLQEIMLYGANSGPTTFTFKRQIWEGTAQDPDGSNYYGSAVFSINTGTGAVTASTDIRAPIFYDSNDTTYYIDPANGGFNLRGGNSNRVTFNSGDSGIIVTNAEGISSNVRLGCAWGRPGIYNGSSITVGAETQIDFVIANAVKAYIDSSSNLFSNGSVRSPIFYDSNNTAYYIDAASTSILNNLRAATISAANHGLTCVYYGGGATPTNGYLITTNIDYSTFNMPTVIIEGYAYGSAAPIHLEIVWYAYNNSWTNLSYTNLGAWDPGTISIGTNANGKVCLHLSGLIYYGRFNVRCIYDQGNAPLEGWTVTDATTSALTRVTTISKSAIVTSITGNSATTTLATKATRANGNFYIDDNYGNTVVGLYSASRYQGVYAMGDSYKLAADGNTTGTLYGIAWSHPNAGGVAANLNTHGALILENGAFLAALSGSIRSRDDMRSPIFYDSNNTAYYIDAASTSVLNAFTGSHSGGSVNVTSVNGAYLGVNNTTNTNGYGISLYNGASAGEPTYGLMFQGTATFGTHGSVTGDWATYFTMNNDNTRGWIFRKTGGGGNTASISAGGIITASSDVRAPIFYDSGDTTYYVDPAGTSRVNTLYVANVLADSASGNGRILLYGNLHIDAYGANDIYCNYYSGRRFRTFKGVGTGAETFRADTDGIVYAYEQIRSPIFYDHNNTSYYVDPASTSRLNIVHSNYYIGEITDSGNGDSNAPFRFESDYSGWSMIFAGTPGSTNGWGTFWAGNDNPAYYYFGASNPNEYVFVGAGSLKASIDLDNGQSYFATSVRSPIFYDSDNTAYYIDAASASILNTIRLTGKLTNNGSVSDDDGFGVYWESGESTAYAIYREAGSWTNPFPDLRIAFHTGIKIGANAGYNGVRFYDDYGMGTQVMSVNNGSDGLGANNVYVNNSLQAGSSLRAPIFYDSNDTTYYVDPNSLSNIRHTIFHIGSNLVGATGVGVLFDGNYTTGQYRHRFRKYDDGAGLPLYIDYAHATANSFTAIARFGGGGSYNPFSVYGTADASGDFRAPIFYDSNDTGYYIDAASTSSLNSLISTEVYARNWFRNNDSGEGIYNQATTQHFYSDDVSYWNVASSSGAQGIRFRTGGHGGTVRGYVYANDSNDVGFLNNAGNWRVRVVGGDYTLIDGSSVRAQTFIDSNDTSYYGDFASTSILNRLNYQQLRRNFASSVYSGTPGGSNNVKTFSGVLVAGSANATNSAYTVIETSIPQDSYQMGGFTINWFENYSSTNAKTTVEIAGYWNPTSNGGFIGFEYTTSNPNIQPTIRVGRNSSGNTVFILDHFSSSYTIIIARDLWLGYNSTDGEWATGWTMTNTTSIAAYSNVVSAVLRVGPTLTGTGASGSWGISVTGSSASCTGNAATVTNGMYLSGDQFISGAKYFTSNKGATSTVGANNTYSLEAFSSDAGAAGMSFHRGGYYAVNMGLDPDNVLRIGGWSASANRLQLDMSGNLTLAGVVDATQFRDSANTAYYVDPASQSKLYDLLVDTNGVNSSMVVVGSNQPSIFLKTRDNARNIEIYNSYGNFGIYLNSPSNYIIEHVNNGASSYTAMQLQGTDRLKINSNGLTAETSVRSPYFYDSDNTAYYIDGAGTSILNLVRTRNTFGERVAVTSAASTTVNTQYNVTELTMSASITTLTLSNIQASTIVHMWTIVTVGNGTTYSITWPAAIKWPGGTAPTITATNAKRDIYQFVTYDGGTNIYAIIVGQNL